MVISNALLHAKSVGVRNFRNRVFKFIKRHDFLIVTEHGVPASVLLPYKDILEIADILEELEDKKIVKAIAEGRRAIRKGVKGVLASRVFGKVKG